MKTNLLALIFVCIGLIVNAQSQTNKGNFILGNSLAINPGTGVSNLGSFSFISSKYKDNSMPGADDTDKVSSFNLNPNIGYFIMDKFAVGLNADLFFQTQETEILGFSFKLKSSLVSVGPIVRYYFLNNKILPFVEAGANYGFIKVSNFSGLGSESMPLFSANAAAGTSFLLGNSASFDVAIAYGYLAYKDVILDTEVATTNIGLKLGFKIFIGKKGTAE